MPHTELDARQTLRDLGEFSLIESVVLPLARDILGASELGGDCSFASVGDLTIAVSADVGPRPLVQQLLGFANDQEAAGWHAAVATASDIATAGATPLLMTNTIDAPPDLDVADLQAFLKGYFQACRSFGFQNGGGDLRQGKALSARTFGIGIVEHGNKIGRSSLQTGDLLVLLGPAGRFISTYLAAQRNKSGSLSEEDQRILRFPTVQIDSMRALAKAALVTAASDSSDGVLGAVQNIVSGSGRRVRLNLHPSLLSELILREASLSSRDPWNLFFFWGDWSVVAVVPASSYSRFQEFVSRLAMQWLPLGVAVEGAPGIEADVDGHLRSVNVVRNENFVDLGFNAGVGGHVEAMLSAAILK